MKYKAKLSQIHFTELGNKSELDQLGLELWLDWSLEDFPGWGGVVGWGGGVGWGWGKAWNKAKAQHQLGLGFN